MSRVEINAGGRHVIIDADPSNVEGGVERLIAFAREAWDHTKGAGDRVGPAIGFQAERHVSREDGLNGGGAYRSLPPEPVRASVDSRLAGNRLNAVC